MEAITNTDILSIVCAYLNIQSICSVERVNRDFKELMNDDYLKSQVGTRILNDCLCCGNKTTNKYIYINYVEKVVKVSTQRFEEWKEKCVCDDCVKKCVEKCVWYKLLLKLGDCELHHVLPDEYKTEEICKIAINTYGCDIQYVPEQFMTEEMCTLAVTEDCHAIKYIPELFKTEKLCKLAVTNDCWLIHHIPILHMTPEMCEIAVYEDPRVIQTIPDILKTEEMCKRAAINSCWEDLFQHIPHKYMTEEFCKIIVKGNKNVFKYLPNKYRTEEICGMDTSLRS
jgi:hypothetical protein